jgi:hypothetical protein
VSAAEEKIVRVFDSPEVWLEIGKEVGRIQIDAGEVWMNFFFSKAMSII